MLNYVPVDKLDVINYFMTRELECSNWRGSDAMMPLGLAKVGETNIIKKVNGRDEVRQHLAEMGFVVGAEIRVVNELGGNLILSVKESRVALDKTMAMRIMI